jgi:hypothetical protein
LKVIGDDVDRKDDRFFLLDLELPYEPRPEREGRDRCGSG